MTQETKSSKENQIALADYVEDMHVVETHIEEALRRQLSMFSDQPEIRSALEGFHQMTVSNRDALAKMRSDFPKERASNTVKDVGSTFLGVAAGLIDKIRSEGNAKALRDDFTAFNLAAVSYGMLNATGAALGSPEVADLAEKHLRGYVLATRQINTLIPAAVVHDLDHVGLDADADAVKASQQAIEKAWKPAA